MCPWVSLSRVVSMGTGVGPFSPTNSLKLSAPPGRCSKNSLPRARTATRVSAASPESCPMRVSSRSRCGMVSSTARACVFCPCRNGSQAGSWSFSIQRYGSESVSPKNLSLTPPTRATGAGGMLAAAARAARRASSAANRLPAALNRSRRLTPPIVAASVPVRQPAHIPLHLLRELLEVAAVAAATLQHRDAAGAGRYDHPAHAALVEAATAVDVLVAQDEHGHRSARAFDHQVRHVVPAEPATLRVNDLVGGEIELDARAVQRGGDGLRIDVLRRQPALRLALHVRHDVARQGIARAQQPQGAGGQDREQHARRERPLPQGGGRPAAAARVRRLRQPPPQLLIERTHFGAQACALRAALQVLLERRRARARLGADQQARFVAGHGAAPSPPTSGTGVTPHSARSLLRARNSRVSTAVEDRESSRAISSVEKPPMTCSSSGSR